MAPTLLSSTGVDLSGIIFVVLAVSWAVYLIPKALQHHEEVARTRSIDRFSSAMRVLARREPVNRRDSRLVVTPRRPVGSSRLLVPSGSSATTAPADPAGDAPSTGPRTSSEAAPVRRTTPAGGRAATRAAARRRRRILGLLLVCDLAVAGVSGFGLLPWWSVAIPLAVTVLYLVLCRTQVRGEGRVVLQEPVGEEGVLVVSEESVSVAFVPRRAVRVEAKDSTPRPMRVSPVDGQAPMTHEGSGETAPWATEDDDTASVPAVVDVAVVATEDGGTLWDPLPMTLPTYVTKPKVKRTVRTIDLGAPDTWSSGRNAEDSRLAAQADEATKASTTDPETGDRRAVGG